MPRSEPLDGGRAVARPPSPSPLGHTPALLVEDYRFWFKPPSGKPEGPPALDGVNCEIEQGAFVLILGRSGSGKSTLALNLVGIYPDYFGGRNQGRISLDVPGRGMLNRRELPPGERFKLVNMLFQNPEDQIVTLTVEEEVAFALENYRFPPDEILRRIDRSLDLVGLSGFRDRSTIHLSGGEKQRVALAAMLAMEPRILILDEPTSNLDPAGTADVLATIDRVRDLVDVTMLVIEHEVDEVFDRADTVLLVEDEHVQGPFTPREFIARHGLQVRDGMGLWIPQACEVGLELRAAGVEIPEIPLNADELVAAVGAVYPSLTSTPTSSREVRGEELPEPRPDREVVIEVRDVRFAYDGGPEVLRGVDLTVRRHELLAILGQNGSGKSTLASLFNGIEHPTSGSVLVDGKPTTEHAFAQLVKRVAHIFQVPEKQFISNTVYDELAHGLRALRLDEQEVDRRVLALLETVRLRDRRDASPYVLSHGQKRRLSVAAMVIGHPEVVVLDEPTFGQDFHQAQNLMEILRGLADEGAAVVFITHDMRLVAEYADRVAVLCEGSIISDGSPGALFDDRDTLRRARLRPPAVHDMSRRLLGDPVLTTRELCQRIQEVSGAERRTVI